MVINVRHRLAQASASLPPLLRTPTLLAAVLAAGLAASLAATVLMLALRLVAGIVTLPEMVGERILPLMSAGLFVQVLIQLGKIKPLAYALIGQVVLGALAALLFPVLLEGVERVRARRGVGGAEHAAVGDWPSGAEWLAAGALSLLLWLLALALFWPVLAENLYGYPEGPARFITIIGLAAIFALYGAVLALAYHALAARVAARAARGEAAPDAERRALLARSAAVAGGSLVVGALGAGALIHALFDRSTLGYDGSQTASLAGGTVAPVTPTSQFYVVTKNVVDPQVVLGNWALEVNGLVGRPGTYDLARLRALPQVSRYVTLECISNEVGGHLVSNAQWHGVTLASVLADRGGIQPAGKYIYFTSADGYHAGQALDELLAAGTLLAWEMNGQPLTDRHGFPLRTVVPGYFGEHSSKWLTGIEVVDQLKNGFYQSQGWYWGPLHTLSRIDSPVRGASLTRGPVHVSGIAFAGTRGIRRVEVSADGGGTWHNATLTPPLSSQSWVLWSWPWMAVAPGDHTLTVRATDGTGAVQTAEKRGTVPEGATGYHQVRVVVR